MSDAVKEMIEKLKAGSPDEKRTAANALGDAARKGLDIGAAKEAK